MFLFLLSSHSPTYSCRFSTGAPDPDVQNSRIRLFEAEVRYASRACAGVRSGKRSSNRFMRFQKSGRWERRLSQRFQTIFAL
jgi:hypothetical protein